MKTREEIFNEVLELYRKRKTFISIAITDEVELYFHISLFYPIIEGKSWNWLTDEETETRKVAKTGEFEDDLYYLIDLLIEDAKAAQMV